jgi:PAS domain S-box-containing protein
MDNFVGPFLAPTRSFANRFRGRIALVRHKRAAFCFLAASLATATGIGASIFLSSLARKGENERLRLRFESLAVDRVKRLDENLQTSLNYVDATQAFFASSGEVNRDEFHRFVQHFFDKQPYIIALEWVPCVHALDRASFERATRREGFDDFVIADSRTGTAAGARDTYYPILFTEPFEQNRPVLGLDYGSIPERLDAMEAARRLERAQATRTIPLHRVEGREYLAGVQVFAPVFSAASRSRSSDNSVRTLSGFVSAVCLVGEMTEDAFRTVEPAGVDMFFYEDGADGERKHIYTRWSTAPDSTQAATVGPVPMERVVAEAKGFAVSQMINVAGLKWWVVSTPAPRFFEMNDDQGWRLVLIGGIAMSVVTGYILLVTLRLLTNREEKARLHLAAVVESSADAIYTKGLNGTITTWNRAAEALLGYAVGEIVGKSVALILPRDGLQESSRLVEPGDNGTRVKVYETIRIHRNGTPVDVSLSVSPIRDGNGEIVEAAVIARDITERKHIERMKDDFIHLASHQLRTPLSAVRLYTEMLLAGYAGEVKPEQHEFLNTIASSTHRMVDLVSTLLNISRIEGAALMVRPLPHPLGELLKDAVSELEADMETKRIGFQLSVEPDLPAVFVDPVIVHEIYSNLLSNAIKYTPEGGSILVSLHLDDDQFVTAVEDTGYGIPRDDHQKIFSRFFRGSNILQHDLEGTGMGLYLVRSLCDLSGCKIWFDSHEGKGTTFWFSVPRRGMKERSGKSQLETIPSKERFTHV